MPKILRWSRCWGLAFGRDFNQSLEHVSLLQRVQGYFPATRRVWHAAAPICLKMGEIQSLLMSSYVIMCSLKAYFPRFSFELLGKPAAFGSQSRHYPPSVDHGDGLEIHESAGNIPYHRPTRWASGYSSYKSAIFKLWKSLQSEFGESTLATLFQASMWMMWRISTRPYLSYQAVAITTGSQLLHMVKRSQYLQGGTPPIKTY